MIEQFLNLIEDQQTPKHLRELADTLETELKATMQKEMGELHDLPAPVLNMLGRTNSNLVLLDYENLKAACKQRVLFWVFTDGDKHAPTSLGYVIKQTMTIGEALVFKQGWATSNLAVAQGHYHKIREDIQTLHAQETETLDQQNAKQEEDT